MIDDPVAAAALAFIGALALLAWAGPAVFFAVLATSAVWCLIIWAVYVR